MIQTLNTISLVLALLAFVLAVVSVMIFFNWKIRDVHGFLTGKTKADALANLRGEANSEKRYALAKEVFASKDNVVANVPSSSKNAQVEKNDVNEHEIEPQTTEFTCVFETKEDEESSAVLVEENNEVEDKQQEINNVEKHEQNDNLEHVEKIEEIEEAKTNVELEPETTEFTCEFEREENE